MARTATRVDDKRLKAAVEQAEAGGGLASLGELWEKVAERYNLSIPAGLKAITPSGVRAKVMEGTFHLKTVSGRAKSAAVDKKVLQKVITEVESAGLPRTWAELFASVAELYNKRTAQNAGPATLQALAIKEGLKIQTPKGKKGFRGGERTPSVRTPKADKFAANTSVVRAFEGLRESIPVAVRKRFLPVVERAEAGSRTAAVKLKCLDCSGYNTAEIKHCPCDTCSLWAFRPYQGTEQVESGDVLDSEAGDDNE